MAEREKNMRNMKKALAAVAAVATLASLAACGGSDGGNDAKANAGDADKADLVFWGWDTGNTMKALIADFEKANPGITVKFNNTGTASDTQTALSNAVAAGKGAPDVVMLEDPTVTQFAVTGDLVDLTAYGADKLEDIDVIIEMCDARLPMSSSNPMIAELAAVASSRSQGDEVEISISIEAVKAE